MRMAIFTLVLCMTSPLWAKKTQHQTGNDVIKYTDIDKLQHGESSLEKMNFGDQSIQEIYESGHIIKATVVTPGILIAGDTIRSMKVADCTLVLKKKSEKDRVLKQGREFILDRRNSQIDRNVMTLRTLNDKTINSVTFNGRYYTTQFRALEEHCGGIFEFEVIPLPVDEYEEATLQDDGSQATAL